MSSDELICSHKERVAADLQFLRGCGLKGQASGMSSEASAFRVDTPVARRQLLRVPAVGLYFRYSHLLW